MGTESKVYDYGIIGGGVAGLQLALAMLENPFFTHKTIIIIESTAKDVSDKTLSFWEKGIGKWDDLITKSWSKGKFINADGVVNHLNLGAYKYKTLPAINLYDYAIKTLTSDDRVTWVNATVSQLNENQDLATIITDSIEINVRHCFDSRVAVNYADIIQESATVYQPFLGWEIAFEEAVFDPETFTMMDFQFRRDDDTSFFYILPTSNRSAMVEYTLFVPEITDMSDYEDHIKAYIQTYISEKPYEIQHREQGLIPMSTYPFHKTNSPRVTKIGTAGSWVRPSSGYAFKYIESYVEKVIDNLINGRRADHKLLHSRHRMMDRLLLDILQKKNALGPGLFETMYTKTPIEAIFKFLDGQSSLIEDIRLMNTFKWKPFFQAIKRQYLS